MKFTKEARIGLLVVISVVIFFAGFYFLKGSNVFSSEYHYYGYYESVQGLQPAAAVQVKGVNVGKVSQIVLEKGKVRVTFALSKKFNVPQGTVARLVSLDLLGTKAVRFELGRGPRVEKDQQISTAVETGIIDNLSSELSPLVADVRKVVGVLDSVLHGVSEIVSPETKQNISASMAALDVTMQNFSDLSGRLNREGDQLTQVIRNSNSIAGNLAKNNQAIDRIIDNANLTSEQLRNAPIQQTMSDLQQASNQLNALMTRINRGEGSVGMAFNDKQLYEELTRTLTALKALMSDVEQHPSRYINVTIFGRRSSHN